MAKSKESARQRTIVSTTLAPHLGSTELAGALLMLDEHQLNSASGTVAYISAVARHFNLADALRKRLCLELYDNLREPLRPPIETPQLPTAPASAVSLPAEPPQHAVQSPSNALLPAPTQVFLFLAERLTRGVTTFGEMAYQDFVHAMDDLIPELGSKAQPLAGWPELVDNEALQALGKGDLAELLHMIYMALCEALGPVEADALLHCAMAETSAIPAAEHFSPRELL